MILSDIMRNIDINVPNNLSASIKVSYVNDLQKQIYREFPVPDVMHLFTIVPGIDFFSLPADCAEDQITNMMVGDSQTRYSPRSFNEPENPYSYVVHTNTLWFTPSATKKEIAYLYYKPRPVALTASTADLASEPSIPSDYHKMLEYGVSQLVAMALPTPNFEKANYYENQYEKLLANAKRLIRKYQQNRVAVVRSWT